MRKGINMKLLMLPSNFFQHHLEPPSPPHHFFKSLSFFPLSLQQQLQFEHQESPINRQTSSPLLLFSNGHSSFSSQEFAAKGLIFCFDIGQKHHRRRSLRETEMGFSVSPRALLRCGGESLRRPRGGGA